MREGAAALWLRPTPFGILYDDAERSSSFSITGGCQFRGSLSNSFPRTTPRFESYIPAGRTGWMRIYSFSDIGILGAVLNQKSNAASASGAFSGGHNLHTLTLSASAALTVPIFPPSC